MVCILFYPYTTPDLTSSVRLDDTIVRELLPQIAQSHHLRLVFPKVAQPFSRRKVYNLYSSASTS